MSVGCLSIYDYNDGTIQDTQRMLERHRPTYGRIRTRSRPLRHVNRRLRNIITAYPEVSRCVVGSYLNTRNLAMTTIRTSSYR
jgi:hypothetical protein